MPKLAANLSLMFNELPFEARFEAAAAAGFRGVECQQPYGVPARDFARHLRAADLSLVLMNTPEDAGDKGIACHPGREDEFAERARRAVDYAAETGCPAIHCMAGVAPEGEPPYRLLDRFVANLALAAEIAAPAGIRMLVEPINTRDIPGYFVTRTEQALDAIAAAAAANVGLQFDVYHRQIMQGDVARAFEAALPLVRHVQIADNPGRHEPGTGEIAYPFLLGRMDELGYDGWVGCEYRPKGDTVAGLAWAQPWLAR